MRELFLNYAPEELFSGSYDVIVPLEETSLPRGSFNLDEADKIMVDFHNPKQQEKIKKRANDWAQQLHFEFRANNFPAQKRGETLRLTDGQKKLINCIAFVNGCLKAYGHTDPITLPNSHIECAVNEAEEHMKEEINDFAENAKPAPRGIFIEKDTTHENSSAPYPMALIPYLNGLYKRLNRVNVTLPTGECIFREEAFTTDVAEALHGVAEHWKTQNRKLCTAAKKEWGAQLCQEERELIAAHRTGHKGIVEELKQNPLAQAYCFVTEILKDTSNSIPASSTKLLREALKSIRTEQRPSIEAFKKHTQSNRINKTFEVK